MDMRREHSSDDGQGGEDSGLAEAQRNIYVVFFFFSSRRRHTRFDCDWSSDVCSSDLTQATIEAHRSAWRRAGPGLYEYQISATMEAVFSEKGCERPAYAPIVGSGPNSVFLHYSSNKRRMDAGEILLMDVAAECSGYASDITRTIPVGRKFSKRQKEIYDIVLGAQEAAIAAIKPGMTIAKT